MARDYQREKNNEHWMPTAVYRTALWQIRDYDRMKDIADAILDESPSPPDGMPKGTALTDLVYSKAVKRDVYISKTTAIEKAMKTIPQEYLKGVWNNITRYDPYPPDAGRATYSRYKSKFVFEVAKNLNLI